MKNYRIGDVARLLGISADTLRYYEKIGLLPMINRTDSGTRMYNEHDLSRLRFIRRAQTMKFKLREIAQLMRMRDDPTHARDDVRLLTRQKLDEVDVHMADLQFLRKELQLLLNLCTASEEGCPILEGIDETDNSA